jgi:uncharacterized protein YbaA (DUF1428 family)
MRYVDGFVVPVPKKNLPAYSGKVRREHGALEYIECMADDVKPGKHTSFPQSVKLEPGEIVVFSYIVFITRAPRPRQRQRDEGSAAGEHDGPEGDALRRQAHDLRRVQGGGRAVRLTARGCNASNLHEPAGAGPLVP